MTLEQWALAFWPLSVRYFVDDLAAREDDARRAI